MKKLLLFAVLALPAFPQFFGGSNASKIRGINVLGPLTVSDGCALVYVAASTRFECGAGSGGGTGNGIVAVTVSAATSATLTHNAALATPYIAPFVCREDTTNLPVIPATTTFSTNAIDFTFSPAFTGKCAASTGGSGISGTISTSQICYGSASNTCAGSAGLTFTDAASVRLLTLAGGSSQSTNPLLDITNSAGSSHWLTVLGDGKVGINTNAPGYPLSLASNGRSIYIVGTSPYIQIEDSSGRNVALGAVNSGNSFVGSISATNFEFRVGNAAKGVITPTGSWGIGTSNTTPANATLSVLDAAPSTGATATWIGHDGSGTYSGVHLSALTTKLTVVAGLTQSTNLQEWQGPSGTVLASVGSGGLFQAPNGDSSTPGYAFASSPSTGLYFTGTTLVLNISGANVFSTNTSNSFFYSTLATGKNVAGVHSTSGILGSGTWDITGTATTSKPYLLIEPAGTTSTGWSTSGTGIGVNAASGFTGNLLDLQVAGASKVTASRLGDLSASNNVSAGNAFVLPGSLLVYATAASGDSGNAYTFTDAGGSTARQIKVSSVRVAATQSGTLLSILNTDGSAQFTDFVKFGATSSFPALKRSTTGLVARLADDSADTWFQASQFRSTLTTPASAAATGVAGTIVADADYVYVCTATNIWKRVAIATW